ncbi:hypothetical protein [Saccharomonospora glauca]|jgi:hypothetical protein|uniref:Uncharacterized protein n=1 Tax=Saccharomonospora glauca K62 TaxID=928724 RepID=I1D0U4_9PSEU|nr:hypothetical protein [Saccharomonospora glauca]EIE98568.1 hypothetical protein SacglDRAFT_01653 [Saccharomonospora glauca K62]
MVRKEVEVVITALYVAVLAAVLGGIGAVVRDTGPAPDVDPGFARRVAEGLRVLRRVSDENAKHTEHLLDHVCRPGSSATRTTAPRSATDHAK